MEIQQWRQMKHVEYSTVSARAFINAVKFLEVSLEVKGEVWVYVWRHYGNEQECLCTSGVHVDIRGQIRKKVSVLTRPKDNTAPSMAS